MLNFVFHLAKQRIMEVRYPPTGGGPPPKSPSAAEEIFINDHENDPAVQGIPMEEGLPYETINIGKYWSSKLHISTV